MPRALTGDLVMRDGAAASRPAEAASLSIAAVSGGRERVCAINQET
jgi:hypothetical protein